MQPTACHCQQPWPISQLMHAAAAHGVPLRTVVPAVAPLAAAAAIGNCPGGTFGAVAVLLAIPAAVSLQVAVREIWRATSAGQAGPAAPQGDASPDFS